jgi:replicative DNA helicase
MVDAAMPHNEEAERSVLGACLIDEDSINHAVELLADSDFYQKRNQLVFHCIALMAAENKDIDILTVEDRLSADGRIEEIGGSAYLRSLVDSIPSGANIESHCKMVHDCTIKRAILNKAIALIQDAQTPGREIEQINAQFAELIATAETFGRGKYETPEPSVKRVLDEIERGIVPKGIMTGIIDLDNLTGGLKPGNLMIVAGLPSHGKSTLALNMTLNMAKQGIPVCVNQLEGTADEFIRRALSCMAKVKIFRDTIMVDSDAEKVCNAGAELAAYPIHIDESCLQIEKLHAKTRWAVNTFGAKVLVVDYLQRIPSKGEIYERTVASIGGLKNIAKDLKIAVIALSQFNRDAAKSERPQIHQMLGSSSLEQDADIITILHDGRLTVDKLRNGKTNFDGFELFWDKEYFKMDSGFTGDAPNGATTTVRFAEPF